MLCVAGGKGGVGKTTTAVGLARAAAREGARPVVVDADRDCPDLAHVAGVPAEGLAAFADGAGLDESGRTDRGVRYLCADGREADDAVRRTLRRLGRMERGRGTERARNVDRTREIDRAGRLDRPVLVDAPAGAGRAAALPLRFCDRALLVTSPTVRAQRNAVKTAAMARALEATVVGSMFVRGRPRECLLRCPTLAAVPPARSPLEDSQIRATYGDALRNIEK